MQSCSKELVVRFSKPKISRMPEVEDAYDGRALGAARDVVDALDDVIEERRVDHLCKRVARLHGHLARELDLHGVAHHAHVLLGQREAQRRHLAAERRRGARDRGL
eukprot:scaffold66563_cov48-Phaeocystis_antarctica.AAC.1